MAPQLFLCAPGMTYSLGGAPLQTRAPILGPLDGNRDGDGSNDRKITVRVKLGGGESTSRWNG